MDRQLLQARFADAFGTSGGKSPRFFHAPGRVNLIGEHTDYNGGYVFPCALSLGSYGAACRRDDGKIRLVSGNMPPRVEIAAADLPHIQKDAARDWANYPIAVAVEMHKMGCIFGGFDLYVEGDLPNGAGLSSSASIELLTATVINTLYNCGLDNVALAQLSQRAENGFVGVNCGIMDQFASAMGRKDNALLLQCATLEYQYVPIKIDGYTLVITNTNKQRGLTDSKYNERRAQCEAALAILQKNCPVSCLCEMTVAQFEQYRHTITDTVIARRAAHAVYENARTLAAVNALHKSDLAAFGAMMNDSHISLRDWYEVTGAELDALAEAAWQADGVLGSRMTGAGFGGCTISIVRTDAVSAFEEKVGAAYQARTHLQASFYPAEIGDGARELV